MAVEVSAIAMASFRIIIPFLICHSGQRESTSQRQRCVQAKKCPELLPKCRSSVGPGVKEGVREVNQVAIKP